MRVNNKLIFSVFVGLLLGSIFIFFNSPTANSLTSKQISVGTTYYGGNYDNGWVVDNEYQCSRINQKIITETNLDARLSSKCKSLGIKLDDNGLGYLDDTPLHNRVSFAELSNDYNNPDYSALGNLPAGTKIEISYGNRCLIAEKLDVGVGEEPSVIKGHHRALDLWWQTARSLNFTNGFDVTQVKLVPQNSPLTPLGKYYICSQGSGSVQGNSASITETQPNMINQKTVTAKKKAKQKVKVNNLSKSSSERVLGTSTIGSYPPPINDNKILFLTPPLLGLLAIFLALSTLLKFENRRVIRRLYVFR